MELIASSKEDKRMFENDSRELRRQLADIQVQVHEARSTEKRTYQEDTKALQEQLLAIQSEVRKATESRSVPPPPPPQAPATPASPTGLPRELEDRLDNLQRALANNTHTFMTRVDVLEAGEQERRDYALQRQSSSAKKIESRLDSLQKEVANARTFMSTRGGGDAAEVDREVTLAVPEHRTSSYVHQTPQENPRHSATRSATKQPATKKPAHHHKRETMPELDEDEEALFDTYVSTKSATSVQTRDDSESGIKSYDTKFSHESDVGTALALGELTEEQTLALESLDLGGTREQIADMLGKVPGLTKNQVTLLVDVASSLAV